jgi:AraC family transcriptional activator of tynA and feaB
MSAILAYCRRNLTEPGLSPAAVARAFGISLRTLHLRFQATGQSFGEWLLANRLELARKVLSGPHPASRTIADIAFGCGFRDLSHFNRTFRARFGLTPGECRSRP